MKKKPTKKDIPKEQAQYNFIFKSEIEFTPIKREEIYDASHIFPQIESIIHFLKNFDFYRKNKVPIEGGAIFWGLAGTGKTLFARYLASASGARFINMRKFPIQLKSGVHAWQDEDIINLFKFGSKWVEKNKKPIVLLLDQIDDWMEIHRNVLSELETQIDGFSGRNQGIFLVATSRKNPAYSKSSLFRPGRIGIHIAFSLPDRKQQETLLKGFLSEYPHNKNIDFTNVVYLLSDLSPASIKFNVAAARALAEREQFLNSSGKIKKQAVITENHLLEIFLTKILDAPSGHELTPEEQYMIRIHEIGHYLVGRAWGFAAHCVSTIPGIRSLGLTFSSYDEQIMSFDEMKCQIASVCGGLEAEQLFGFSLSTTATGDIEKANEIAGNIVYYGGYRKILKNYGLFSVSQDMEVPQSNELQNKLEKELAQIIESERKRARETLKFFGKKPIGKAEKILASKPHKVILQKELDAIFQPKLGEFHKIHKVKDHIND